MQSWIIIIQCHMTLQKSFWYAALLITNVNKMFVLLNIFFQNYLINAVLMNILLIWNVNIL